MDDSSNSGNQSRFIIAAALSFAVLIGWSYFFAPKKPVGDAANPDANAAVETAAQPTATPTPQPVAAPTEAPAVADTTPARSITIKSPLYQVTFDSKGAVATSWIIRRNEGPRGHFPVFADGSTPENEKPLQLIGQKALEQEPRELPSG